MITIGSSFVLERLNCPTAHKFLGLVGRATFDFS